MPTLTRYWSDALAAGSNHHATVAVDPGAAARIITGWIVGTLAAGRYARMDAGVERTAAGHTATVEPSGAPDNALGDCFRLDIAEAGTFAAGNWTLNFEVQGETRGTSPHDGQLRIRVWKGTDPTGAGATELTTSTLVTAAYTQPG